jgi:hypothetical protein
VVLSSWQERGGCERVSQGLGEAWRVGVRQGQGWLGACGDMSGWIHVLVLLPLRAASIKAESAAIIYAMDPVYAAIFSFLILDERLGAQGESFTQARPSSSLTAPRFHPRSLAACA